MNENGSSEQNHADDKPAISGTTEAKVTNGIHDKVNGEDNQAANDDEGGSGEGMSQISIGCTLKSILQNLKNNNIGFIKILSTV